MSFHLSNETLRSKINAAMTKLAEQDKDLAEQGLEKVLTQLGKVPGACVSNPSACSTASDHAKVVRSPSHLTLQRPSVDPSATLEVAMSTTVCSGKRTFCQSNT